MKYNYIAAAIVCTLTFSSCGDSNQDAKAKATPIENEPSRHVEASQEIAQMTNEQLAVVITALAMKGKTEALSKIVKAGANPNIVKFEGMTPLICACADGKVSCVKNLLEIGADVNARGDNGETALMAASLFGRQECVKVLIQAGANVHARSDGGKTALEVAEARGELECANLLRAAGAKD